MEKKRKVGPRRSGTVDSRITPKTKVLDKQNERRNDVGRFEKKRWTIVRRNNGIKGRG